MPLPSKIAAEGLHFGEYGRGDERFANRRLVRSGGYNDTIGAVDDSDRPVSRQVLGGDEPAQVTGILRQDQGVSGRPEFRIERHGNVEHPFLAG